MLQRVTDGAVVTHVVEVKRTCCCGRSAKTLRAVDEFEAHLEAEKYVE